MKSIRFGALAALASVATLASLTSVTLVADATPTKGTLGAGVSAGGPTAGPAEKPKAPTSLDAAKTNGGSVTLGDDSGTTKNPNLVPPTHTVKKGDTLWAICDEYFANPWQWPRVWSFNAEILNPHWIYPGEVIRLKREGGISLGLESGNGNTGKPMGAILKPQVVPPGTVFLRDLGFVYDEKTDDTGEVVGSPEDTMLLTTYNKVYVRVTGDQAKKLFPGDSLTVFHYARTIKSGNVDVGKVVQILGTVRVDRVEKGENFVEGTIVEALDVIERGARVGPIERRMDVVPPVTNQADLRGSILTSVHPQVIYGANQVVLVDRGTKQGVRVGNRLFVVRKGDPWRKGLDASGELAASSVTLNTDSNATIERKAANVPEDAPDYPEEVIAEVRILRVRDNSATGLVTNSKKEIEPGDGWVMKKGY
ncbi:MAG: LysM peptidoglycan-binding domain-containing protein [Polyangiales bacterium]